MPYQLHWEPNGVYWKYYGIVIGKEIINATTIIYGDPRFDNLKYKLLDFLDAENIKIDDLEIAKIAYQHRAAQLSNPNVKNALVVKPESTALANKFSDLLSGSNWEVQVFHDLEAANTWVGRKPTP